MMQGTKYVGPLTLLTVLLSIQVFFFLSGANGLQTQAVAAANGGCGLIFVPEIKFVKKSYTGLDGSYGPLLSFHDRYISEKTHRKAERISCIQNYRIHLMSADVKSD